MEYIEHEKQMVVSAIDKISPAASTASNVSWDWLQPPCSPAKDKCYE